MPAPLADAKNVTENHILAHETDMLQFPRGVNLWESFKNTLLNILPNVKKKVQES